MPRGVYNRNAARTRASKNASLSARLESLSKELASLTDEVREAEELKKVVEGYIGSSGRASRATSAPRRRGRPRKTATNTPAAKRKTPTRRRVAAKRRAKTTPTKS
jgi:hypothetical protein